ncbi:MAG TPA: AAA family ATPase [Terracidiphilus sp.]|nr:AAA family ATPase [Terracidiphilus sp.]
MPILNLISDAPGAISIALIEPDNLRREEVAGVLAGFPGTAVYEHASFPADLDDLPLMLEHHYDVVLIGIDSDPVCAFDVVEGLCACNSTTVMVYTTQTSLELAIRFMHAGAREFLTLPLIREEIADALDRVLSRRVTTPQGRSTSKKLFVFLGAKGGCGVTTIASNFAVALAQESGEKTLLIDFGVPLGDAAINLGMAAEYSTANALQDSSRLDANFLRSLLARHGSGLSVLPAPSEFSSLQATNEAIDKLLTISRHSFDYVVVDAGSRVDLMGTSLFGESAILYLITQVGVSELRNSNRLITQFFSARGRKLQIVLNRYTPHGLLFDDQQITKALTRPAQWKIPDDYASARRTRSTAAPIALEDSPISNVIRQMARTACGMSANPDKKKGFSLFGRKKDPWPGNNTLLEVAEHE